MIVWRKPNKSTSIFDSGLFFSHTSKNLQELFLYNNFYYLQYVAIAIHLGLVVIKRLKMSNFACV